MAGLIRRGCDAKEVMEILEQAFAGVRRTDPFERTDITSNTYYDWMIDRIYLTYAAQFIGSGFPEHVQRIPAAYEASQLRH